jgi:hypothetical protein
MPARRIALVIVTALVTGLSIMPAASAATPPITFAATAYYPTGQYVDSPSVDENGTAVGDFNGDGRPDIVAVDQAWGNTVVIQYNKGNGTFTSPGTAITIGSGAPLVEQVVAGRLTASGRDDIVVLTSYGFYVLRNDGAGHFTQSAPTIVLQAPFQDTAILADLDGNGTLDLAIKTPTGIQSELGNGDGTFHPGPFSPVAGAFTPALTSITRANINGDTIPDLFASDAVTQDVFALRGNGDGSFTETGAGAAPFVPGSVLAVKDTPNGLDSAVALDEFNFPGTSGALLVNNGAGGFQPVKTYNAGCNVSSGVAGDLNGDGWTDVVSSDTSCSQQVILAGNGGGGLVAEGSHNTGIFPQTPVIADFTGDGRPDVAVTTYCPPGPYLGQSCLAVLVNRS